MSLKYRVPARIGLLLMASAVLVPAAMPTAALAVEPGIPEQIVTEADALAISIRQKAADLPTAGAVERDDRAALAKFYLDRGGKPVWTQTSGLNARATEVMAEIRQAGDWGLDAQAFDLPTAQQGGAQRTPAAMADAELKLSQAVLKYARHARGGRFNPSDLTKNLDVNPQLYDPRSIIVAVAETDGPAGYLRRLHPKHPQFEKLRQAYLGLRGGRGADAGLQRSLPSAAARNVLQIPPGPKLQPGQSHPHIALLRQRLGVPPEREAVYFDDELANAVEDYQQQNGFKPTGKVDNALRASLNGDGGASQASAAGSPRQSGAPASGQAARILANMERWRYVPEDLGRLHVWISIPEYMFRVVKDGQVIHTERLVAGKTDTQTAIFSANMQEVIFNPNWNVPLSIKVKEIQPNLARSEAILQKQNLRIKVNGRDIDPGSVDWGSADMRNYHFYQPPGGGNVLGIVKFAFPNKHDIYMHDTPSKSLFNQDVRAYSHGCMRVRDPRKLAEVLLREDKGWDSTKISQALATPDENRIGLSKKIPVHVTYFTTTVDENGRLVNRNDIYGHDERITLALSGTPVSVIAQNDPAAAQTRSVQEAQAGLGQPGQQGQPQQVARRTQRRPETNNADPNNIFSWLLN